MLYVVAAFIAFLVGFAMKRGGLCTYVAAVQFAKRYSKFCTAFNRGLSVYDCCDACLGCYF